MKSFIKKNLLESNILVILFFFTYLLIALCILKDYGISLDEPFNRMNGLVSLKYVTNKLSIPLSFANLEIEIPNFDLYLNDINVIYGVIFDLPLAFLEVFFNIQDSRDIYLLRHLFTFLIFFTSTIFFYKILKFHFKKNFLSIIGVFILIISPRIFAHSFFNSKDIVFLSLIVFAIYFNLKCLNEREFKYIFLASFFSALATSLRVLGCYIPLLTIFIYYLNYNKNDNFCKPVKFFLYSFISFLLFLYILWPYLWGNPFINFADAFLNLGNLPYNIYTLYFGQFINTKFLPWHYFFTWFSITTPIIFLFLIFIGIFLVFKKLFINFLNLKVSNDKLLWKNNIEMNEFFILCIFLVPIFMTVFLNSTLYNGWRHLFFVYPSLIFFAILAIDKLNFNFNKFSKFVVSALFTIQIFFVLSFLIKAHPVQSIYFNLLAKKFIQNNFTYDYWGIANHITLRKLVNQNASNKITIATSSFTDLHKTKLILKKELRNKIIFTGTDKQTSNFIFTNYYFNAPPYTERKFRVPKNYKSIIKFEVDGLLINEIFERID